MKGDQLVELAPVEYRRTLARPSKSNALFVELMGTNGEAYLWIGDLERRHVLTLVGAELLHELANGVRELVPAPGAPRKKPRRARARRAKR